MPNLFFVLFFFAHGFQQKSHKLQRKARSLSVGGIIIENNLNEPVKVRIESNIIPIDVNIIEIQTTNQTSSRMIIQEGFTTILPKHRVKVSYNTFVPAMNSLARCSVFLLDSTKIIDSETIRSGEQSNLQYYGDIFYLQLRQHQLQLKQD